MDVHLAELSRSIDPATLGRRIRNARVAAGLTQTEAADGAASTAYISRIEAGQRRPDLKLLARLAERLGTTVEELLVGITRDQRAELQLELDYAELELSAGSAGPALARVEAVLAQLPSLGVPELERPARLVRAFALESSGDLEGAILALTELTSEPPHDLAWIRALIGLSRCYREAGDLGMAVEVGERATSVIEEQGLSAVDEALQLTLAVATAYFERGDTDHAVLLCRQTLARAEELGSPTARGSAYWNASMIQGRTGSVREAISLARKAIALFEQNADNRNLARLRTSLAAMQLRLDPPEAEAAKAALEKAAVELDWSSASPIDKAANQLSLARAYLILGNSTLATEQLEGSFSFARDQAPFAAAEAVVLQGQIAASEGRTADASASYREAIHLLTSVGADRRTAELWFELGGLLQAVGDAEAALDAYRRAAVSTGLSPRGPMLPETAPAAGPDPIEAG